MNALLVLITFILFVMFLESGHIEILFVLLLILGLVTPEQLTAIARELGKLYYMVNKAWKEKLEELLGTKGNPVDVVKRVGEWRMEREKLIKDVERALKENKKP